MKTTDFMYGRALGEGAFARVVHCRLKENLKQELKARLECGVEQNIIDDSVVDRTIREAEEKDCGVSNVESTLQGVCKRLNIDYIQEQWNGVTKDGKPGFERQHFAVKIMDKAFVSRLNKVATVMAERRILSKLKSKWVIDLHYSWSDEDYLYMVMELAPGGELLGMINSSRREKEADGVSHSACSVDVSRFYLAELTMALEFIHRRRVYHRDLKPENLLIMSDGHMKLTDFGTAMEADIEGDATDFVGTAYYVSPEVLAGAEASRASDLWGFGCIMYHMLVGKVPFRAPSEYFIFQVIQAHLNFAKLLSLTKIESKEQQDASHFSNNSPPIANATLWLPLSHFSEAIRAKEASAINSEYYYQQDRISDSDDAEPLGPVPADQIISLADSGQLGSNGIKTLVCPVWCGEPVWKLEYPASVPPEAQELIAALLVEEPEKRLGASAMSLIHESKSSRADAAIDIQEAIELDYLAIRNHPFFNGICNEDILNLKPPYDPKSDMEVFESDHMSKHHEDISDEEAMPYDFGEEVHIAAQEDNGIANSSDSPWASALHLDENIVHEGVVTKQSGFSRKTRQLVLTSKPRLLYFDPNTNTLMGEIKWTNEHPVSTFKKDEMAFDVKCNCGPHAGRDYKLTSRDEGGSDEWIRAIGEQLQLQRERSE